MAGMNALIALGFRPADPVGAFSQGQQVYQQRQEMQRQGELRNALAQYGGAAMSGDQNALNALAAYDPQLAFGLYRDQRQDARAEAELGMSRERLALDRQNTESMIAARREDAARQTREWAATVSEAERQRAAAEARSLSETFAFAHQQGPEAWSRAIAGTEMDGTPYDEGLMEIADLYGMSDGLSDAAMPAAPIKARPGDVFLDPGTMQPVGSVPEAQGFRQATAEEAQRFGMPGQIGPDGRFYPLNPPSGTSLTMGPDGSVSFAQGSGVKPGGFTEAQSKDNVYSTRARGALPTLDKYGESLTSRGDRVLGAAPLGVGREFQGGEYQVAETAGQEFLSAILRKDTGAAITRDEHVIYGKIYLPQPGDGADVLAYKQQARARAVSAIEAGMSPSQILAQEQALRESGGSEPPAVGGGDDIDAILDMYR